MPVSKSVISNKYWQIIDVVHIWRRTNSQKVLIIDTCVTWILEIYSNPVHQQKNTSPPPLSVSRHSVHLDFPIFYPVTECYCLCTANRTFRLKNYHNTLYSIHSFPLIYGDDFNNINVSTMRWIKYSAGILTTTSGTPSRRMKSIEFGVMKQKRLWRHRI